jgi:hypothetical protein
VSGILGLFVPTSPGADQRHADPDRERKRAVGGCRLAGGRARTRARGCRKQVVATGGPEPLETGRERLGTTAPVGVVIADEGADR